MNLIKNWREITIIIILILSILAIHPMKNMVKVIDVKGPASYKIYPNDIIREVNGIKINSEYQFYKVLNGINNSFSIEVKRESIPYVYLIKDLKLQKENSTIFVENTGNSNLKFSYEFTDHNVFKINGSKRGIVERLERMGIRDAKVVDSKLYTRYSSKLVEQALNYRGKIEARLGNKTVFSNKDIKSYCKTSTGCIYGIRAKLVNGTEKYFYEIQIKIDKNKANEIRSDIKNLPIGKCEMGTCYLNESLEIYLDDKKIGEILIPAEYKNKFSNSLIIIGFPTDLADAKFQLKELDGALASEINANVTYIGSEKGFHSPWKYILTAIFLPLIFGLFSYGFWRDRRTIVNGVMGSIESLAAFGVLSMGILIDKSILYGAIFWSLFFSLLFFFYSIRMRNGLTSKQVKMKSLDTKIEVLILIVSFILIIWKSIMIYPLIVSGMKLLLTRKYFFK